MKGLHACLLGFSGSRLRICSSWRQIRLIIRFLPGTLLVALALDSGYSLNTSKNRPQLGS